MADQFSAVADDTAGTLRKVDESELTVGSNTVVRQRMVIADDSVAGALAKVDTTFDALRVTQRPLEILGSYSVAGTVAYAATTVNGIIGAFRWGDATRLAIIRRVRVGVMATAVTTAGLVERQLIVARSWSASDTGGTALTPSKKRASFGASLLTDVRVGGFLTAGTRTLDASPHKSVVGWMSAVGQVIPWQILYEARDSEYPLVLVQNEGFEIRLGAAESASTRQTFFDVDWDEVTAFP